MLASLLTIVMSTMLVGDGELGRSPVPAKDIAKVSGDVADYFEATPYRTGSNQIWSIHWDRGLACLAATKNNAAPIA